LAARRLPRSRGNPLARPKSQAGDASLVTAAERLKRF
jgi:hypothetical protein